MNLEDFIKETLISIKRGIKGANDTLNNDGGGGSFAILQGQGDTNNKGQRDISFDVAVTTNQENGSNVGGGIRIAIANLGSEFKGKNSEECVSRIKFNVISRNSVE